MGGIYIIRKFFGIILLAISVRLFMANITLAGWRHCKNSHEARARGHIQSVGGVTEKEKCSFLSDRVETDRFPDFL